MGVGLAALQRNAHGHLAQRRAGQRVRPAQRLRTQMHVNAEGSALPHQAVQQERCLLGQLVVFDEELLEFVDDEQDAGQNLAGIAKAGDILHAGLAEALAALFHLGVQALHHAQAEFPFAFDGDHARVRQRVRDVGFEFDPFLEVDQIQLDFVGTVAQRGVGDQGVQQRRFARARLAGDEHVLGSSLPEPQMLQAGGAGPAQGDVDATAAVRFPVRVVRRGDSFERHFHALGRVGGGADGVQHALALLGGRILDREWQILEGRFLPGEFAVRNDEHGGVLLQVGQANTRQRRLLGVDAEQDLHAAARPARGDAQQTARGGLGKAGRKVGHDQHAKGLGHFARGVVVRLDGGKLVAQILLDHRLDMLGQIGQALLDLCRLGPDAMADECFVVIGQVHEGSEILAEAHRVDDRQTYLARRHRGEQAQQHQLKERNRDLAHRAVRLDEHRRAARKIQQCRQPKLQIAFVRVGRPRRERKSSCSSPKRIALGTSRGGRQSPDVTTSQSGQLWSISRLIDVNSACTAA